MLRDKQTHEAARWLHWLVGWNDQLHNCLPTLSRTCQLQCEHRRSLIVWRENYTSEPGPDKKSGCISTGYATFLYLACWSWCRDKKQASAKSFNATCNEWPSFNFFYCTCPSFWRWNDGSLCEFNQDLWNTGLVPCGERPRYTRVCGNSSLFWLQHAYPNERHVVTSEFVIVACCHRLWWLFFLVLVSTQSTAVDVCRELHPVHQELCDFPSFWCDKVLKPV